MCQETRESDSIIGDIEQTLGKVNLLYADGLYDMQETLMIYKNKDRENITASSERSCCVLHERSLAWK